MALIVEDGSCVDNSDSYASVIEADIYLDGMGMTTWADLATADKERALRRATAYMVARYRSEWKGAKVKYAQSLDWPRQGVTPDDNSTAIPGYAFAYAVMYNVVPKEVKQACIEFAFRAAAGPLLEDASQKLLQETVGPITTRYDPNSPDYMRYRQIDMMLAPFLRNGGNQAVVKLFRR